MYLHNLIFGHCCKTRPLRKPIPYESVLPKDYVLTKKFDKEPYKPKGKEKALPKKIVVMKGPEVKCHQQQIAHRHNQNEYQ